jgi:uncharacterized membrane protein YeaQ/YmgE (transglycosylase-associated protein family)
MFDLMWRLVAGLIIGVIARFLLPGKENIPSGVVGWVITGAIGIGGAFLGTVVKHLIFGYGSGAAGWILSILGAIVLLLAYGMIFGKKSSNA